MKNKKIVIIVSVVVVLALIVGSILLLNRKDNSNNDALKFSQEYSQVSEDNVFVYRDIKDIIKILKNGTGLVYLGFPECPWCQRYVKYLNEVANDLELDKIYYFNISEDRKNNSEEYQEIVAILDKYLTYDKEGNKRVYVPTVVAVKQGEILGFDDETAYDTKGFSTPEEYWSDEEVDDLKIKLITMINQVNDTLCTECNE